MLTRMVVLVFCLTAAFAGCQPPKTPASYRMEFEQDVLSHLDLDSVIPWSRAQIVNANINSDIAKTNWPTSLLTAKVQPVRVTKARISDYSEVICIFYRFGWQIEGLIIGAPDLQSNALSSSAYKYKITNGVFYIFGQ